MEDYIDFFVEVEGRTLVAVLTWDFDNWCLDGYYSVKGTDLSSDYILSKIHGNMDNLRDWEENKHPFPNEFARECTDDEIEVHFKEWYAAD